MTPITPDIESPKARQILEGAQAAFLELGYEGASTDEIARRAKVSKGTLYNYFRDKRTLFTAFVEQKCQEQAQRIFSHEGNVRGAEATLRKIARSVAELMTSPAMPDIYRLVVAEAERFPELGRSFYDSGPGLGVRRLTQYLAGAVAIGELRIDDIELAASQFIELCRADLFHQRMFCLRRKFSEDEIDRIANGAVDVFLRAYGVDRSEVRLAMEATPMNEKA